MGTKVIFHSPCFDGFGAAWAARKVFGDSAEYIATGYGKEPPDVTGDDVYILDFSYPRALLEEMHEKASSLLVLDHHKTAEADLKGLPYAIFDMNRSGAGITWDELVGGERAWIIDYIEDRDLWNWKLPNSREVSAFVSSLPYTFEAYDEFSAMDMEDVAHAGKSILDYIDRYIEAMIKNVQMVSVDGHTVPGVNAPYMNVSELCNKMALDYMDAPFAVAWFQRSDGMYQYSLRSRKGSDFDVSTLAKKFGGGGHKHAAGFSTNVTPPLISPE